MAWRGVPDSLRYRQLLQPELVSRAIRRKASYLSQDPPACNGNPRFASLQRLVYTKDMLLDETEEIISRAVELRLHHQSCPRSMARHRTGRHPRSLDRYRVLYQEKSGQ